MHISYGGKTCTTEDKFLSDSWTICGGFPDRKGIPPSFAGAVLTSMLILKQNCIYEFKISKKSLVILKVYF